jgi:hypothetical protein
MPTGTDAGAQWLLNGVVVRGRSSEADPGLVTQKMKAK